MASAFNLTAQLNLRGPANIKSVVSDIRKQLGSINANVNVTINNAAQNNVAQLNASLTALNNTLRQTQNNANAAANAITAFSNAVSGVGNAAANLNQNLNQTAAAAQNVAQQNQAAANQTNNAANAMAEFGAQSYLAVRRFAAFTTVTTGIFAFTNAVRKGIDAFIEFDRQFVKLQQVTGESSAGLNKLSGTISNLARGLGVSSAELTEVSSTLAQAGLSARDTERALKALALSALAPSFDNMNQTVEGSIALMKQFGISAGDLEKSLGAVNAVAAKFAVESSDIIAAIQRTGGVFASASRGVSEGTDALNEFIAVFTSVRATTRESAETIATGLRTIFTRIQRGDTIEALKEFGVNLTDAQGKFVGAYKAVQLLSEGLNQIDPRDLKFSQIVEELGGFRQIGKVIPLIQQFATAQEALKVAQAGQASLSEDAATAQLSLANQVSKVREEFLALFREIGGTDTFQAIAKSALGLASALIQVADSVKGILPILTIMLAFRGARAAVDFGGGFLGAARAAGGARGLGARLGGGAQTIAVGGRVKGYKDGGVPVALMPGETVLYPDVVSKVGVSRLRQINHADKNGLAGRKNGGSLRKLSKGGYAQVPGTGRTDSFYTTLPEDSFVIRTDATSALGGPDGVMKAAGYKSGGRIQKFRGGSKSALQYSHLGTTKKELRTFKEAKGVSLKGSPLDNYVIALESQLNQDLRQKVGRGISPEELLASFTSKTPQQLFKAQISGTGRGRSYGSISDKDPKTQQVLRNEFAKLAPSIYTKMVSALSNKIKRKQLPEKIFDPDTQFLKKIFVDEIRTKASGPLRQAMDRINEYNVKSKDNPNLSESEKNRILRKRSSARVRVSRQLSQNPRNIKRREERDYDNAVENAIWSRHNLGGIIQHFMSGSTKPLASMGKADLLKEARSLGIDVPIDSARLLDPRAKGSETVRADLIKKLEEQRLIKKTATEKTSARAKKRNIAVVGLTGEQASSEVTTPGLKSKRGGRGLLGVPATLQTGALPPEVAKRVQAIIRNRSEKIVAAVGKVIAEAAGTKALTSRGAIRDILAKQLPDLSGLMFESGIAAAGAPYDPKSKAIDFNRGLGKELSSLFGIDPKALTDATNDATQEQAKRKVKKGQFDRGRRDAIRAKKAGLKRTYGGIVRLASGGIPLVDDLPNAPGSILPIPGIAKGSALYSIIQNGGGAIDYDRTLQRTVGDAAYANAKTPEQREAVLAKYFRDPQARLSDAKTARLTQFGKQLQELIKKGVIQPKNLSIISKSARVPGLAEHISSMFGIPVQNMAFTRGGSKIPALEALRAKGPRVSRVSRASGGEIPIMAQEGEYIINRASARAIGYSTLSRLNKYHTGGRVGLKKGGAPGDAAAMMARAEDVNKAIASLGGDLKEIFSRIRKDLASNPASLPPGATVTGEAMKQAKAEQTQKGTAVLQKTAGTSQGLALKKQLLDLQKEEIAEAIKSLGASASQAQIDQAILDVKSKYKTIYNEGLLDLKKQQDAQAASSTRTQAAKQNRQGGLLGRVSRGLADMSNDAGIKASKAIVYDAKSGINKAFYSSVASVTGALSSVSSALVPLGVQAKAATINVQRFALGIVNSSAVKGISTLFSSVSGSLQTFISKMRGINTGADGVARDANGRRMRGFGKSSRGGMGGGANLAFGASFALPMIAEMVTGGEAKSASQARSNTLTQGAATSIGSGIMIGQMASEIVGPFGGMVAGLVTAGVGVAKAFADAENAAREFNINTATDRMETSLEKASEKIDKFANNLKDATKEADARSAALSAIADTENVRGQKETAQRGLVNFFDTSAYEMGTNRQGDYQRSQILFEKGVLAYISSLNDATIQAVEFSSLIPKKAREAAKDYTGSADISKQFLESKIRSGTSISDMQAGGGKADFDKFAASLAKADSAVQEQIMTVQNNAFIDQKAKDALIANIIAIEGETKARALETQVLKAMELEQFNRSVNNMQNSLERMFQNMEQAIGRNVFELDNLSQQADLSAAALSGQAKAGSVKLQSVNVLQNPRAYSQRDRGAAISQAAGMFGTDTGLMKGLLTAAGKFEDTIMSTINKTIKEDPTAGNEKIGIRIQNNISKALQDLQLPPDISSKLAKELQMGVGEIRKKGDEKLDFGELMEKIPQLGKVMDSTRRAQEVAIKALEHWQNSLNDYANANNQMVDMQIEANSRMRKVADIGIRSQMELDKTLGKEISLRDQVAVTLRNTAAQTGGATNPADIAQNIRNLENARANQQRMSDVAAQRGPAGRDEFMLMQNNLQRTNIALRENYDALKNMADNTEIASAAMAKINEIQQKRQAGVNLAERLVTSSPQELATLNQSMARLNNNMAGRQNLGSTSETRKETLDVFNMIAPFLGEQQNAMKANVLESMLKESGVGIDPMMAEVLNSLRNPEADPQMQEAIGVYKQGVAFQQEANRQLALISQQMAQNTADIAAEKLAKSLAGVRLSFENEKLNDIASGIRTLIDVVQKNKAGGMATGGIVYAAGGSMINFQPRGTDTVPAMLTPGEFVVNRAATQRNLPLLKSINNGYSKGGKVKYYERGGLVALNEWQTDATLDAQKEEFRQSSTRAGDDRMETDRKDLVQLSPDISESKIKSTFQPLFTYPNNWFLVNKSLSESVSSPFYDKPPTIQQYDSDWVPGISYGQITARVGGSAGATAYGFHDYPKNKNPRPLGDWPLLNSAKFKEAVFGQINPKTGGVLKQDIDRYNEIINFILGQAIPNIPKNNTDLMNMSGVSISLDSMSPPPITTPRVNVSSGNPRQIAISGLSYDGGDDYVGLLNKTAVEQRQLRGSAPASLGLYGLTQFIGENAAILDFITWVGNAGLIGLPDALVRAATLGRFGATREKNRYSKGARGYEGDAVSQIVAGIGNMKDYSQGGNAAAQFLGQIKTTIPGDTGTISYGAATAGSSSTRGQLQEFAKLREDFEILQTALGSPKFVESATSVANKDLYRNIIQLYDGISPFIKVGSEFVKARNGEQLPITIFGSKISSKWNDKTNGQSFSERVKENANITNAKYSEKLDNFMRIAPLDDDGLIVWANEKTFAWADSKFNDYDIFSGAVKAIQMSEEGQNVSSIPKLYNSPKYKFSYQQMKAKFWNEDTRRYGTNKSEFVVVEPQTGGDPAFNPFVGLDNAYIYAKDIASLEKEMNRAAEGDYTYNLTRANNLGLLKYLPKDDAMGREERTFKSSNDENSPFLTDLSFFGEIYKNSREERLRKQKIEEAKTASTMTDTIPYAKQLGLVRKRLTLARIAHSQALASGIPLKSGLPENINDVNKIVTELNQLVPRNKTPGVDVEREKIDAWRALFTSINNDKEAKTLQNLGFNFADDAFTGEVKKPGPLGTPEIAYYKNNSTFTPEKIKQIIDRQIAIKLGSQTSTEFSEGIQEQTAVEGGKFYSIAPDGKGGFVKTLKKESDIVPKTWGELRDTALNPQNVFPSSTKRSDLIDVLMQFYDKGKNRFGGPLLPDEFKKQKLNNLKQLKEWYNTYQDVLLNTGLTMDGITGDPVRFDQPIPTDIQSYEDAMGWIKGQGPAYTKARDMAQEVNTLETANQYGPIPGNERLLQNLIANNEEAKQAKEKAEQVTGMATGGVVYASRGTLVNYQPQGTDTVPAMLTPGEFVINRSAAQRHLPLLTAINSGNYSAGGIIKYLNDGGIVFPNYLAKAGNVGNTVSAFSITDFMNNSVGQIIGSAISTLADKINNQQQTQKGANGVSIIDSESLNKIQEFTNRLKSISDTLAGLSIPSQITIKGSFEPLQIIINGDAALAQLTPDLQGIVMSKIKDSFAQLADANSTPGAPLINPFGPNGTAQT